MDLNELVGKKIICEICKHDISAEPCGCTEQDYIKILRKELADLRKEHKNAIGLKNTYFQNWKDAKGTIDSQAEVINNLTVRWGKKCRELSDLKKLVGKLIKARNRDINGLDFYIYLGELEQAVTLATGDSKEEDK